MNPIKHLTVLLTCSLLISPSIFSQQKKPATKPGSKPALRPATQKAPAEAFYVFDENWKGTTAAKARYLARQKRINDTCWQWDTYNYAGPMIRSERFKDQKGTTAHGQFVYYNEKGKADSICYYTDGYADGTWTYFNDTGRVTIEKTYDHGKLVNVRNLLMEQDEEVVNNSTEKGSQFPGENAAWRSYVNKSQVYPLRALKSEKQGDVMVFFTVNPEGKVLDPKILKSIEFSLDEEALRVVKKSPLWIPAVKNGVKVKSYQRQPVSFNYSSVKLKK